MLNITDYQRNTDQNYNDVSSHTSQDGHHQKICNKCCIRCGEKRILLHCWWECKLVRPLWRTVWEFLKKLNTELPHVPVVPLLGIHLEKNIVQKDTCTPVLIAALFTIPKTWKQPECPSTEKWVKEMWYIYTMEYYSAIKKNEIMYLQQHWWT